MKETKPKTFFHYLKNYHFQILKKRDVVEYQLQDLENQYIINTKSLNTSKLTLNSTFTSELSISILKIGYLEHEYKSLFNKKNFWGSVVISEDICYFYNLLFKKEISKQIQERNFQLQDICHLIFTLSYFNGFTKWLCFLNTHHQKIQVYDIFTDIFLNVQNLDNKYSPIDYYIKKIKSSNHKILKNYVIANENEILFYLVKEWVNLSNSVPKKIVLEGIKKHEKTIIR